MALDGGASQSSTYSASGVSGYAAKAIDGNRNSNFWDGHVSATSDLPNSSWQVNLDKEYDLEHIYLFNRGDLGRRQPSHVLSDFFVRVYEAGTLVWQDHFLETPDTREGGYLGSVPDAGVFHIRLPDGTHGDSVEIALNGWNNAGNGLLSFAEVEVYQREIEGLAGVNALEDRPNDWWRYPRLYREQQQPEFGAAAVFNLDLDTGRLHYQYSLASDDEIPIDQSSAIVVSPDSRFVYTLQGTNISVYRHDAGVTQGGITEFVDREEAPDEVAGQFSHIEISPNGSEVYVGTDSGMVIRYKRDAATGELTDAKILPWTAQSPVQDLAMSGNGVYVYAASKDCVARFRCAAEDNVPVFDDESSLAYVDDSMQALPTDIWSIATDYTGLRLVVDVGGNTPRALWTG